MFNKTIRIIGVPIDLGQNQRGVDMGPSAIRYAGLSARLKALGFEIHDAGNLYVPVRDSLTEKSEDFLGAVQQVCEAVGLNEIKGGGSVGTVKNVDNSTFAPL